MNARLVIGCTLLAGALITVRPALAEEKLPPIKPIERLLPPKGIDIGKAEKEKLEARLATLTKVIADAKLDAPLQPDVEIYTKAVRWALDFDEFYDPKKDIAKAHAALDIAQQRLDELRAGKHPWTTQRGLLARGYRSDIDDSVQPYGLLIPENLDLTKPVPLLVWLHGRGDKETDLHFITNRQKNKGEFAPDWCITLHPYGRGTIGFKFAGEIDVLDAIESVKKRYKIDEDRIALAGFSMGGAGAWHIGAHYADRFCVVHAGAGFVETAKYNKLTPDKYPAWYEQKLWGWYDVPCYTRNLFNVPVIAYSGENDKQKQAADLMAEAFKAEGRELRHIIGPGVEHKYEAKAKEQVLKEIKSAVEKGRNRWPKEVHLQTRTLQYNTMFWVTAARLDNHWSDARIDASIGDNNQIRIATKNISIVAIEFPAKLIDSRVPVSLSIDSQELTVPPDLGYASWTRVKGKWTTPNPLGDCFINQRWRGLHGTIDEAFLSPFVLVTPSKPARSAVIDRWTKSEVEHFINRWRATFRGSPRVIADDDVRLGEDHLNLVLFGDPQSNSVIARIPNVNEWWKADSIDLGARPVAGKNQVATMIKRSPFQRVANLDSAYIVLNSGPTFREGHDRTNSQQTPKLPDWAIIGLDKDPDAFSPGTIKATGFFDENWKVKKEEKKEEK